MQKERQVLFLGLVMALGLFAGCFEEKKIVGTVSGEINFQGKPVTNGEVIFFKMDKSDSSVGFLDESGGYKLISPVEIGEYQIAISPSIPPQAEPGEASALFKKFPVPEKYHLNEESELTFTVKEGENRADFNLE